MRCAAALLILLASPAEVRAEDLCSNRPGLATGTCILPAGVVQLESSLVDWSSITGHHEAARQLTLGASMVRLGIGGATELQAAWTPWTRIRSRSPGPRDAVSGVGDAKLAAKLLLVDGPVSIAASPYLTVPLAKAGLGSETVEVGLILPADFTLPRGWGLTLSPELDWNADADGAGHHPAVAAAMSLARDVGPRLSLAFDIAFARDFERTAHSGSGVAGASLAWLARPNLQMDIEADTRLYGDAADVELIAGFVYRP